jgi:hypothetical protein
MESCSNKTNKLCLQTFYNDFFCKHQLQDIDLLLCANQFVLMILIDASLAQMRYM